MSPTPPSLSSLRLLPCNAFLFPFRFPIKTLSTTFTRFLCTSSLSNTHHHLQPMLITMTDNETHTHLNPSKADDPKPLIYPIPLSPPLPLISKQLELNRALSASSKSTLFVLSRSDVVFEDEYLIVVNKPQGIYCETVLSAIPRLLQDSQGTGMKSPEEFHLANRLDRDTSGVMVITKSHKVAGKLVKAFTEHKVSKSYIALCCGSDPNWDRISIRSGHGRSNHGAWRVYAESDVGRTLPGGSMVRDMETSFQVLSVNGRHRFKNPTTKSRTDQQEELGEEEEEEMVVVEDAGVDIASTEESKKDEILVRANPRSGRTHQIRLHCQYLGIPICGDVKYEGPHEWKGKTWDGHALHAQTLSLHHPVTGLPLVFQAPLPFWAKPFHS
ncbi:RNA pseudouridine synthase 1 isoform X2 [Macadamia integrifolia]|uniref:RNA pseudouridine synthase 1 isoform X2 n=1 Tax=Macadamia integrifolia TaxID=60698 RepID=UPI001C4E83A2|nr:RNA pseudouridine synthase 1 isoform X2 [Macadamia integrifolia]